jgi:hypothetical protein
MPDGRCNYQLSTINSDIQHRWPMPMQLSVVNYQQSTATSNIRHPASITQGTGNREQERGGNGGGASARSASAINAATRTESREQRAPAPRWHVAPRTTHHAPQPCATSHAIGQGIRVPHAPHRMLYGISHGGLYVGRARKGVRKAGAARAPHAACK